MSNLGEIIACKLSKVAPMNAIQLKSEFADILQPLGVNAGDFFLAASLYHARKVSFAAAAELAGTSSPKPTLTPWL